ncbi:MAG TPA: hypothetical protein VFR01_09100 [Geobacterales bacterium]|nr:hypothetical protein [Geobacterales bacterium]
MRQLRAVIYLVLLVLLAACGPWLKTDGPYRGDGFTVNLPTGWMRSNTADYLLITHDGLLLQYVAIFDKDVDAEFANTKKRLKPGMMPQEAAEVVLDDIASNKNLRNVELLENKPAKVAGVPAFRAVLSYSDKDGLRYRSIYYGFMKDGTFHGLRYSAPARYYFDKDSKTFERIVQSYRLI